MRGHRHATVRPRPKITQGVHSNLYGWTCPVCLFFTGHVYGYRKDAVDHYRGHITVRKECKAIWP